MNRHLALALLAAALAVSGCSKKHSRKADGAKQSTEAVQTTQTPASAPRAASAPADSPLRPPKAADAGFPLPDFVPDPAGSTAQTYRPQIPYTPAAKAQTVYFNKNGKAAAIPVPHGYYRVLLGQTADGRNVAQDFYQDSKTPQTAPFTLAKGADIRNFSEEAIDGISVWFAPDGAVRQAGRFAGGSLQGAMAYYLDGRLVAQTKNDSQAFYHPDGRSLMAVVRPADPESGLSAAILYRTDGNAAAVFLHKDHNIVSGAVWDTAGREIPPKQAADELKPMLVRMEQLHRAIFQP